MISQHYFTFPFYLPRVCRLFGNWPQYLFNYLLRRRKPARYRLRNGFSLLDATGTLAGTIAVVFVRREYGPMGDFRTIVDIGANMGSFTVYAALNCPQAKIYCYEPEQRNFSFLKQNIAVNALEGRVTPIQNAVAARSGSMEMGLDLSPLHSLVNPASNSARQTVTCTTLQDIFANNNLSRVDLLKMNCEGAEYEIFENCSTADFERLPNIRLEYHNLDKARKNGDALARLLESRGYNIDRFTRYRDVSGFIWATRA